jgi:transcriptional regulator with XRE-family HTH domain
MTEISYKNWVALSDKALAEHIGAFIKHHRMSQNKTQGVVANAAGISRSTLSLLEKGETVTLSTLIRVLRVLDQLRIMEVFSIEEIISPLLMAKMEKYKRRRARGKKEDITNQNEW